MPVLGNARHEAFAQAWARTKSASEAAREIGVRPDNSNRLTKNDQIRLRVDELLGRGADRTVVTLESLIREAGEIQEAAIADKQFSAATQAFTAKAKLSGNWIERAVNENVNVNYAIGDEPETAEEWSAKYSNPEATAH